MAFGAFAPLPLRLGGSDEEGLSPEQHARICADLVAVKRVTPLASFKYQPSFVYPYPVTMLSYYGQNGSGLAYAPIPSPDLGGSGDIDFQWPASYFEDEYGVQHPWRIRAAIARCHDSQRALMYVAPIARGVRIGGTFVLDGIVSVRVW